MPVASPIGIYMIMLMTFFVGLGSGYYLSQLTFKIRRFLSLPLILIVALLLIPALFNFLWLGIILGVPVGILIQLKDPLKYGAILLIICFFTASSIYTHLFPGFPPLIMIIPTIWFISFVTLIIVRFRLDQKAKLKQSD